MLLVVEHIVKVSQSFLLLLVEVFRDFNQHLDILVASTSCIDALHALSAQTHHRFRLESLRDGVFHLAVNGRHRCV